MLKTCIVCNKIIRGRYVSTPDNLVIFCGSCDDEIIAMAKKQDLNISYHPVYHTCPTLRYLNREKRND